MPSLNQQLSPQRGESHTVRWVVIAALVAGAVIGLVLLMTYGGGGSSPGY